MKYMYSLNFVAILALTSICYAEEDVSGCVKAQDGSEICFELKDEE